jgi:putative tricarboxylic transport membrane protein
MENLLIGFGNVLQIKYLLLLLAGVAGGISIGSLPGLTATMGVALLLPVTFGMEATSGFLMLIGIYVGAVYGGSVAAILVRTPGTPAAAATVFDGNEFSKRGEGGRAIGISTTSSAIGGLISALMLIFVSPYLAEFALKFSSAEYFALAFFGLTIIASISAKSLVKGLAVGMVGLLISSIGLDPMTGYSRFTFGSYYLFSGFSLIPVMIGLFAMPQIYTSVLEGVSQIHIKQKVTSILPTKADLKLMLPTAIRSGFLGTFIGSIPGAGADIAAFTAYNEAKRWSKHPEKFGTGIVEGVAAPEAANNGVTGGALIPLLTLGVPGDAVAAILLGALTLQGLQPGPILFRDHIELVYTIFSGVMVANVFMFILGILGIRLFTKIVSIPKYYLMPIIFILCIVGSYAINNSFFDVLVMMGFGVVGYFMQKVEMSGSPIVLAMILGPMAEENLRKALVISEGSPSIFLTSPISLFFLIAAVGTIVWPIVKSFKNRNQSQA